MINIKLDNSFNCKAFIIKFNYKCRVDNKIFFSCNARQEKVVCVFCVRISVCIPVNELFVGWENSYESQLFLVPKEFIL